MTDDREQKLMGSAFPKEEEQPVEQSAAPEEEETAYAGDPNAMKVTPEEPSLKTLSGSTRMSDLARAGQDAVGGITVDTQATPAQVQGLGSAMPPGSQAQPQLPVKSPEQQQTEQQKTQIDAEQQTDLKKIDELGKQKLEAAQKGDYLALGNALLQEKELAKKPAMKAVMEKAAGMEPGTTAGASPEELPAEAAATPVLAGSKFTAPGQPMVVPSNRGELKEREQELIHQAEQLEATGNLQDREKAGNLRASAAQLAKDNPLGSEANMPGAGGKFLHALGIAGNILGSAFIPGVMSSIPGSRENLGAKVAAGEGEAAAAAGAIGKQALAARSMAGRFELKEIKQADGSTVYHQIDKLNGQDLGPIPGTEGATKEQMAQTLQREIAAAEAKGDQTKAQQLEEMLAGLDPNKHRQYVTDKVMGKLPGVGVGLGEMTDLDKVEKGLQQLVASNQISPNDAAIARSELFQKPGLAGTSGKEKGKMGEGLGYWQSPDGKFGGFGKRKDAPDDAVFTGVKDEAQYRDAEIQAGIIQDNINNLAKDVLAHPEIFDNKLAKGLMDNAMKEESQFEAQASVLGVNLSGLIPGGMKEWANKKVQEVALPEDQKRALRDYLADWIAAKDKALSIQMMMQGNHIGRGTAQMFSAIVAQFPGGFTQDSQMAVRQLANIQQTVDRELQSKYDPKRIPPALIKGTESYKGPAGAGAPNAPKTEAPAAKAAAPSTRFNKPAAAPAEKVPAKRGAGGKTPEQLEKEGFKWMQNPKDQTKWGWGK